MRLITLALTLAVPLAACGKKDGEDQNSAGSGMTADAITSNDITAIDAVTGEAANMAADVDYNADAANALENAAENEASSSTAPSSSRPAAKPTSESPAPATAPTTEQPQSNSQ